MVGVKSYVAFFPNIPEDHWISEFRAQHDPKSVLVAPHMTLVYPTDILSAEELTNEVALLAAQQQKFQVKLVSAKHVPGTDGNSSVFLVPSVGFAEILNLHDLLYSGRLKDSFKSETYFIPHLTVASEIEYTRARVMADMLSSKDFEVEFTFDTLTVVEILSPNEKRVLKSHFLLQ